MLSRHSELIPHRILFQSFIFPDDLLFHQAHLGGVDQILKIYCIFEDRLDRRITTVCFKLEFIRHLIILIILTNVHNLSFYFVQGHHGFVMEEYAPDFAAQHIADPEFVTLV